MEHGFNEFINEISGMPVDVARNLLEGIKRGDVSIYGIGGDAPEYIKKEVTDMITMAIESRVRDAEEDKMVVIGKYEESERIKVSELDCRHDELHKAMQMEVLAKQKYKTVLMELDHMLHERLGVPYTESISFGNSGDRAVYMTRKDAQRLNIPFS